MPNTQEATIFAESNPDAKNTTGENVDPDKGNSQEENGSNDSLNQDGNSQEKRQDDSKSDDQIAQKQQQRNNEDAIPTAGGTRVGQPHWGESQMLPMNAPPPEKTSDDSKIDQSGGPEKKSEKSSGDKDKKHDFMHDLEDKIQHPSQLLHHSSQ
ncbi:hypothetical protein M433DRAFT_391355 [Acidomyces richmondensis BFW]|nr:MAG: hypothetical protein FE78DRAFT_100702 [Acidomyces sp. 'richmondensis']KYG50481.1 hypothetical protein M433DRAFT_391355 [Acidomyces richmondensis BFW]